MDQRSICNRGSSLYFYETGCKPHKILPLKENSRKTCKETANIDTIRFLIIFLDLILGLLLFAAFLFLKNCHA